MEEIRLRVSELAGLLGRRWLVATNNLVRTLSFTCLVLFSASVFSAQEKPDPKESANDAPVASLAATNIQTLAEFPLSPPVVICTGQQLTITANNSTLGSVLAEVHRCTGAQIDIPEGVSANRLFDHLGPGPTREVLTALLDETGYDFVIGSSDRSPDKVESVLLMVRAKDTSETAVADRNLSPARRAYLQMLQNARPRSATSGENTQETDSATDTNAAEQPAVENADSAGTNANQPAASDPSAVTAPGATPPPTPNSTLPAASLNPGSPQSSSTEDQITNMQQLFQQREKMMQSQHPPQPQ
jgi:hypothetical protein